MKSIIAAVTPGLFLNPDLKLMKECDGLTDKTFMALPEPAREWVNEAIFAVKQKKPMPRLAAELRHILRQAVLTDDPNPEDHPTHLVWGEPVRVLTGKPWKFENG